VASEVEICNLALSHLGDEATVASLDPPEGSAQAEHCARFYPVARNALLEMHTWNFSTRRIVLAELDADTWSWDFGYAYPAECLKIISILPYESTSDDETQPFDTESTSTGDQIILTDTEAATCRYTALVTDTTRFSPLFVEALSRLLASYLAGPIIKGDSGRKASQEQLQIFNQVFARASTSNANQRKVSPEHKPAWIKDR
jgi:hypothetical protein